LTATRTQERAPRGSRKSRSRKSRGATRDAVGRDASHVVMLALIILLNLLGLVMVLSASSVAGIQDVGNARWYFERQSIWLALGGIAFAVTYRIDYHVWSRLARVGYFATVGLLFAVLMVGRTVGGSTRWIDLGVIRVQPSELAKLALILFIADLLAGREEHIGDRRRSLHPCLLFFLPMALLVFREPDLGATVILAAILGSMLFVAGVAMRPLVILGGIAVSLTTLLAFAAEYRARRVSTLFDPWADPTGAGWQTLQSLTGLANGGTTGVGLGASRAKWGYLPNSHTDFIFAIIGEELGLVGTLTILAMFGLLGFLGFRTALRAPDLLGQLIAAGITAWLLVQTFINVGGVVGLVPITGVTLPFISFGGSSLLVMMASMGILMNVSRRSIEVGGQQSR